VKDGQQTQKQSKTRQLIFQQPKKMNNNDLNIMRIEPMPAAKEAEQYGSTNMAIMNAKNTQKEWA